MQRVFEKKISLLKYYDSINPKMYREPSVYILTENINNIRYYYVTRKNLHYYVSSNFRGGCSQSIKVDGPFDLFEIIEFFNTLKNITEIKFNEPAMYYSMCGMPSYLFDKLDDETKLFYIQFPEFVPKKY